MNEIATLVIQVKSENVGEAQKRLAGLAISSKAAETATDSLSRSTGGLVSKIAGLLGPLLGVSTAIAGLSKLVTTARAFEVLRAQLQTSTGTAEDAAIAFNALKEFAATTPYDLQQTVGAFVSLTNLGLTPSERALRSYGNTASALSHRLDEMVNAVAKASKGEYDPLKSFGISAQKESDGIAFTFKGVTEKVKNSTAAIESYFIKLGETNFGNSMELRMKTLDGAISNLGDAWDQLFDTIATQGAGDFIKEQVIRATEAITILTEYVGSGALGAYLEGMKLKFSGWAEFAQTSCQFVAASYNWLTASIEKETGASAGTISGYFANIPQNVLTVIKIVGIGWTGLIRDVGDKSKEIGTKIQAYFMFLVDTTEATFKKLYSLLPGKEKFDLTQALADSATKLGASLDEATAKYQDHHETTRQLVFNATAIVLHERDVNIAASNAKLEAAEKLIAAYRQRLAIERELATFFDPIDKKSSTMSTDRLGKYGKASDTPIRSEGDRHKFEALRDSLIDEEEAVKNSEARKIQIIRDATNEGSAEQMVLLEALARETDVQLMKARESKASRLMEEYQMEQDLLQASLENKKISEAQFQAMSAQNWDKYIKHVGAIQGSGATIVKAKQLEMWSTVLSYSANIADQLSNLVKENNGAAKAMFIASKAIAIAQAIIYTELGADKALGMGPFGIPMSSIIRGMGYASIALMAATSVQEYGGKFEHGGMIPAGKYGITQEAGFELVRGPAVVTSARATADQLQGGKSSGATVVNVNNYAGAMVETSESESPDGAKIIDIIIRKTEQKIAEGIHRGNGSVDKALRSSYPMVRGRA